jgi:hypothetical protein
VCGSGNVLNSTYDIHDLAVGMYRLMSFLALAVERSVVVCRDTVHTNLRGTTTSSYFECSVTRVVAIVRAP